MRYFCAIILNCQDVWSLKTFYIGLKPSFINIFQSYSGKRYTPHQLCALKEVITLYTLYDYSGTSWHVEMKPNQILKYCLCNLSAPLSLPPFQWVCTKLCHLIGMLCSNYNIRNSQVDFLRAIHYCYSRDKQNLPSISIKQLNI